MEGRDGEIDDWREMVETRQSPKSRASKSEEVSRTDTGPKHNAANPEDEEVESSFGDEKVVAW
jgi:hypothetical protein